MKFRSREKLLRLAFMLGFVMFAATTVFEWRLRADSPSQPTHETGQVAALKVKGGRIYVRPAQALLDRAGSFGGAALCMGSLLVYGLSYRKQANK